MLVLNDPAIAQHPDDVFKVWPTDRDQDAFRAAMDNQATVPADLAGSAIAQAHEFFVTQVTEWAEVSGDPAKVEARLHALTRALRDHLKLVVIDLEAGDNAQVIFETLNHRGAPLLAADLIKNFVFQVVGAQGLDVRALYQKHWAALDDDYWRQRIARGRQYVPRIDIFVNYWLIMRLAREVPSDRIFAEFRDYVLRDRPNVEDLLAEISGDARTYARMESLPPDSAAGRFRYRVLEAMNSAAVTPLLLWILRWPQDAMPAGQRDEALTALESWVVRRGLCRLTSKEVSRFVIDLLRELDSAAPGTAGDVIEAFLLAQRTDRRLWPSDSMLQQVLATVPVYRTLQRPRLRMLLEALEDQLRTDKSESGTCPHNLTVEHIMPIAWREHWAAKPLTDNAAAHRDAMVHRLGNLTLVNGKLNPSLSNRPWTAAQAKARGIGDSGKKDELLRHSTLKMNARIVAEHRGSWTEDAIERRTAELAAAITTIWPRPSVPVPDIPISEADLEPSPADGDTSPDAEAEYADVGKFRPLTQWLRAQSADALTVTFTDIEDVLGFPLPPSARAHVGYWYHSKRPLRKAATAAGYKPTGVDLVDERVTLLRTT